MTDSKHPPPPRPPSRAKTTTTPTDGEVSLRLANARTLWEQRRAELLRLDAGSVAALPGNLQLAAMTALRVAGWCQKPEARARFERLAAASLFDLAHLDHLDESATLALYASSRYKTVKNIRTAARLPAALDASSKALRDRMFSCAEHTLEDLPAAVRVLDEVRPGTGHLDRANDLVALAGLYQEHPKEVRLDGKKFREGDEAEALQSAEAIFRALGVEQKPGGEDWRDLQHRAWVGLATRYKEVRRWGLALFGDLADVDVRFPELVAASRSARSASRKSDEEPDAPADDEAKPT